LTAKEQRTAIISLDGLSAAQFQRLLCRLPGLNALITDNALLEFEASPFADAQPIWAEILTGKFWYQNGCVGYATPGRSLNDLRIFTEADLRVPIILIPEIQKGRCNVFINTPLVEPRDENRKWLSDGGLPGVTAVRPKTLAATEPLKSYTPRPIISMGAAMADPNAANIFIDAELTRINCASTWCEQSDWKSFVFRVGIFDQLAHLFGSDFLEQDELIFSEHLSKLLTQLDQVLCQIVASADIHIFISAFSHIACKEVFSLNDFFARANLLARAQQNSKTNDLRQQAFALLKGAATTTAPLASQPFHIDPAQTLCASPVRGCIYPNAQKYFSDGIISDGKLKHLEQKVCDLLKAELRHHAKVTLVSNPASESGAINPSLIVDIEGVDLVDNLSTVSRDCELPLSVHRSCGFVWSRFRDSHGIKSVQVASLLRELR
jgi:predicted AlkP superfamily phosphohydrolase/phosphomutase